MKDNDREYNEEELAEIQNELEDEARQKKYPPFILLFLFTTIAVLFALGLSFSTISFLQKNETINSIISSLTDNDDEDKYLIVYDETVGDFSGGINLTNQFPIPDSKGKLFSGKNSVYNFSIVLGSATKDIYYEITAVPNNPDTNKTLNPNYVKLYLTKNENEELTSTLLNGKVRTYSDYKKSTQEGVDGVVLYSDKVTKDDVEAGRINFTLRMWVSDNAIVDENFSNKTFAVKINIYAASLDR